MISVAQDPNWPPVEFTNKKGEHSGISSDYLKLIEQRLGNRFEVVDNLSWQELYKRLQRWEIDMTTSVTASPERIKFWAFTKPYITIPIVIIVQKNVSYIANLNELVGKKVAVVEGYVIIEFLSRDFPGIELVKVKNVEEGFALLQREVVYCYIENMLVTGYYLTKLKAVDLKVGGTTPYENALAMAVRKDWGILAGILQKALDSISEEQRARIYSKWVPVRFEYGFNYSLFWRVLAISTLLLAGLIIWNWHLSKEINYRKKVEAELRGSEEKFRQLVKLSPVPLCIVNKSGDITFLNDRFTKVFGYTADDIPTIEVWREKAYPDEKYRLSVIENWKTALEKSNRENVDITPPEYTVICKDGLKRIVEISGIAIADNYLATFLDFTDRKQAQSALQESQIRYRMLFEESPVSLWEVDVSRIYEYFKQLNKTGITDFKEYFENHPDALTHCVDLVNVLDVNKATLRLTGAENKGDLLRNYSQIFTNESLSFLREGFIFLATGGMQLVSETVLETLNGKRIDVVLQLSVVPGNDQPPGKILVSLNDITDRKKADAERETLISELASKNSELERFTYTVSHDLKTPIITIKGFLGMLQEDLLSGDITQQSTDIKHIADAADRMKQLLDDLLRLAKIGLFTVLPEWMSLTELTKEAVDILSSTIDKRNVQIDIPSDLPEIFVDRTKFLQILINLIDNSIKFMGEQTEPRIRIRCNKINGEDVFIVSDNGIGIDSPYLERVLQTVRKNGTKKSRNRYGVDNSKKNNRFVRRQDLGRIGRPWKGYNLFLHLTREINTAALTV